MSSLKVYLGTDLGFVSQKARAIFIAALPIGMEKTGRENAGWSECLQEKMIEVSQRSLNPAM